MVIALGVLASATVATLEQHSDASRQAEVQLGELKIGLWQLDIAAWNANADVGGSPAAARREISAGKLAFDRTLGELRQRSPVAALDRVASPLEANYTATRKIYEIGSTRGYGAWINYLSAPQNASQKHVFVLLDRAKSEYAARAEQARKLSVLGSTGATLLLLLAFSLVYQRSARARATAERLAVENARLAAINRDEAVTDALTGLRNRRGLIEDLDARVAGASHDRPLMLGLFDLDGFKQYNDTFGHAAGDTLLTRLARRLTGACAEHATAYRMGGDEFCILAPAITGDGEDLLSSLSASLSEQGDRWSIGCSAGVVWLPRQAANASEALGLADVRMYAQKAGRASAGRQTTDALLRVLSARSPAMEAHTSNVATLARATGQAIGLDEHDLRELVSAAELHDVGKTAVPDAILSKPGPLDADEWELMRRHTLLGERIMLGAPALASAARLVRSSHERVDGTGYPDGLSGDQIPLGSRIIFVCDGFDAMTSTRPYNQTMTVEQALAELRRCADKQFDRQIVEVFCTAIEQHTLNTALAA